MFKLLIKFTKIYRDYLVTAILLLISLSVIPLNNHSSLNTLKTYAFGSFAFVTAAVNEITGIFSDDEKVAQLRKRNAELMLENNLLREFALENNELKRLLNYYEESEYPLIPATVVSKLVSDVQGNFIINTGSEDSVQVGMPVINEFGLIGIVTETSNNFSVVRTFTNTDFKVAVKDQRSNYEGILTWDGKKLFIKNVPTTADLQVGDRLVTSEFSSLIPPFIPVGIIYKKETTLYGLLSKVYVEPFVDLPRIRNLLVLKVIKSREVKDMEMNLLIR